MTEVLNQSGLLSMNLFVPMENKGLQSLPATTHGPFHLHVTNKNILPGVLREH